MYSVSDAYKIAIQENTRSFYWSGLIVTTEGKEYPFTNKDIVKGSGYVTRQCSGSSEIELGSVYAAEMGISLFSDIDRYSLENAKITLTFHMTLKDGTIEDVPMGVFFVAEANRKIRTLEIKAYDAMLEFEHAYNKAQSSGYPYDLLTLVCKDCKVIWLRQKLKSRHYQTGRHFWAYIQITTSRPAEIYCIISRKH